MNRQQLEQVMRYLDNEYSGIVRAMSETERKTRAEHWAREVGNLDFDSVMTAVRKLAKGQYMPRTAEVIAEVRESAGKPKTNGMMTCKVFGDELYELRYSDGSLAMSGRLSVLPDWMQKKFRWMANPTPENTWAWDACIEELEAVW